MERRTKVDVALKQADDEFEAHKNDPEARKEALFRRTQARAAVRGNEKRTRPNLRNVIDMVRKWALGKNGNRLAYLSALHSYASRPTRHGKEQEGRSNTREILVFAFPQD